MNTFRRSSVSQGFVRRLARLLFFTFVLTFIVSRIIVLLIMTQKIPDLYLHIGGTHVHHLNYGIFLLCGVGAYLLFKLPSERQLRIAAVFYAIGLALTFDEFGMWLHLGGSYWQRATYDAVAVILGTLGFIAFFPSRQSLRQHHWWQVAALAVACIVFFIILTDSFHYVGTKLAPRLKKIEQKGPK